MLFDLRLASAPKDPHGHLDQPKEGLDTDFAGAALDLDPIETIPHEGPPFGHIAGKHLFRRLLPLHPHVIKSQAQGFECVVDWAERLPAQKHVERWGREGRLVAQIRMNDIRDTRSGLVAGVLSLLGIQAMLDDPGLPCKLAYAMTRARASKGDVHRFVEAPKADL
jgi:hypothetical protein